MRSCDDRSRMRHPRCSDWANARAASASIANASGYDADESQAEALSSSLRMRLRISAAAARVNVMATICPGSSTSASKRRNRRVSRSVLPEPAGAWTRTERAGSSAAMRADWSGGLEFGRLFIDATVIVSILLFESRPVFWFLDAADG